MNIIILVIIGISLLVILVYLFKSSQQEIIQKQWNTLVQSKEAESESNAIKILTETVSKQDGYWEVIGLTNINSKVNLLDYGNNLDDILSIEIIFYWQDKKFHGKNWTPINKENIYDFFKDK